MQSSVNLGSVSWKYKVDWFLAKLSKRGRQSNLKTLEEKNPKFKKTQLNSED